MAITSSIQWCYFHGGQIIPFDALETVSAISSWQGGDLYGRLALL